MHVVGSHMCGRMPSADSQHSAGEGVETVAHSNHCYGSETLSSIQSIVTSNTCILCVVHFHKS